MKSNVSSGNGQKCHLEFCKYNTITSAITLEHLVMVIISTHAHNKIVCTVNLGIIIHEFIIA